MSILVWVVIGLVGGLVCGWMLGGRGRDLLGDMAVGVVGAVLGGFLAAVLLGLDVADFELTSTLVATMGTVLLVLVLHALPSVDVFN